MLAVGRLGISNEKFAIKTIGDIDDRQAAAVSASK